MTKDVRTTASEIHIICGSGVDLPPLAQVRWTEDQKVIADLDGRIF
jgi:hypothetical protein